MEISVKSVYAIPIENLKNFKKEKKKRNYSNINSGDDL